MKTVQDHPIDAEAMEIMQRYPGLFGPGPWTKEGRMGYGFQCGRGWYPLLDRLFSDLDAIRRNDDLTGIRVSQVKQKLGGLRIYVRRGNDRVHERLRQAEAEALETCEIGGGASPGVRSIGGFFTNACALCLEKKIASLKTR